MKQKVTQRKGTWYQSTIELLKKYNISHNPEAELKSTWKKIVKKNIWSKTEEELKQQCGEKGRTVKKDPYKRRKYLGETKVRDAKRILKMRLHMMDIPCNFGDKSCWLCKENDVQSEHYFECTEIRNLWRTKKENLECDDPVTLIRTSKFMEEIEKRNVRRSLKIKSK